MGLDAGLRKRRVRSYALGTSAIVLGMMFSGSAAAQCAPDPTVANGTTNCTGTDADGVTVTTDNSRVTVAAGATVHAGAADAAIIARGRDTIVTVAGSVDGQAKPGILVTSGISVTGPCDPYAGASPGSCTPGTTVTYTRPANAAITVAKGGAVTGANGIVFRRTAPNDGSVWGSVVNNGTITGTAGEAILFAHDDYNGVTITNNATGVISGGIAGAVNYVTNHGRIDGAVRAAIASTRSGMNVINSGAIVSNGTVATLSGTGYLGVTNNAGGTIGGSAIAITTNGALTLNNMGTINGSVVSTADATAASTIDTRVGTINGDLRLGAGNDTLRARFDPSTGRVQSITGAIDGGGGTDTLAIGIDADATLAQAALPTNFELLGLDLTNSPTVTIAPAFTSGSGISLSGAGTVINQAALTTRGPAIRSSTVYGQTIINRNTITATFDAPGLANQFAIATPSTVRNEGVITAVNGGGVSVFNLLENSGAITATNTAVALDLNGTLTNTGTIRSTAGTAVSFSFSGNLSSSNTGEIAGATTGLAMSSGTFTNHGAISGGTTGVALGGTLINTALGTIVGGTSAIARGTYGEARIVNAGRINGAVNLASTSAYDSTNDMFIDDGGVVNGAVRLGGGDDELVVALDADPMRPLAGATGGVDPGAGYDRLRYRVAADADAALALVSGFEGLAYELFDDAALTLSAPSPLVTTIGLAGVGTVTLNGTVSAVDRTVVDATILSIGQFVGVAGVERNLTIVNNGDLSALADADRYNYDLLATINAGGGDVINNGTITLANDRGSSRSAYAIFAADSLLNTGTIAATGAAGAIQYTRIVTNSGAISATGNYYAAITGATTLANSGTISAEYTAVSGGYYAQITNGGTIESRLGTAILAGSYATLVNEATGSIHGVTAVDMSSGTTFLNQGTVVGDVSAYPLSYASSTYLADGGTLTGNLLFGAGSDTFVQFGDETGVSGLIDGGSGIDTLIHARRDSAAVTIGALTLTNFEQEGVRALGAETEVTIRADAPFASDLVLSGDGRIVNTATISGVVQAWAYYQNDPTTTGLTGPLAFINQGAIAGGFTGNVRSFENSGTIGGETLADQAVRIENVGSLSFNNSGTIISDQSQRAVSIQGYNASAFTATNSGTISGGMMLAVPLYQSWPPIENPVTSVDVSLTNQGTITSVAPGGAAMMIEASVNDGVVGQATVLNTGTIEGGGPGTNGLDVSLYDFGGQPGAAAINVTNDGHIRANGGGIERTYTDWYGQAIRHTDLASALVVSTPASGSATIANNGTIKATGLRSVAVLSIGAALDLTNAGTIAGSNGTDLAADDQLVYSTGTSHLAGAIHTVGGGNDRIINTGTITGSTALGAGDDRIENYGTITGDVFLGMGDDTFLHRASAILTGTVDGGAGTDSLIVDATGGGTVNGDQFVNFERFAQTGDGNVTYAGTFRFETIGLAGGTITVAEGETLESDGEVTVTGSDASETLVNRGTVLGTIALGGGNDLYVDHAGSSVGRVDGGTGTDLYRVVLTGDRSGIAARTGFERLAVEGDGTLTLALDQQFDDLAIAGAGVNLTLGGYSIGQVTGSDRAEALVVDGDLAAVDLGGGDDVLALSSTLVAGRYAGAEGNDTLRFTSAGPVTLAGTATGFERVSLAGGALSVSGVLGTASNPLALGDGAQQLVIAPGGVLAGVVDLGAGDDSLRLAPGSMLAGTVSGGTGSDSATIEMAGNRTLASGQLTDFELFASEGTGTLTLAGAHAFQRITAGTDLTVGSDASVAATQIQFGARDDRFTVAGAFAGSVDGGAGSDTLAVSGGSAAAPVAFSTVNNIERYAQTGGFVMVMGVAALGSADLSAGRLVGLAGSTITATQISVAPGATFGSAGVVNGNLSIAGTLSPGASIGTMTVNGNVSLAAGSVSLFEIDATGADRLQVNGALNIASGATLQLAPSGGIRPGVSYDLIVASGGISGSYSNVLKPDSLFGFVVQRDDRIQLLGQFLGGTGFAPQIARSIDYANATLEVQPATSTLFAALPALLNADGTSNARAFAQLTPEAYASATQAGVDNALALTGAARGPAFSTTREDAGPFTFGQIVGQWHTLGADPGEGTAAARTRGYGFLGGIGYGNAGFSIGAFGGYLDTRQTIGALGAETKNDGFVGGVHARYAANGVGVTASLLYDGGEAYTARTLPGATRATGRYDLQSWATDVQVSYAIDMAAEWSLRPRAGITYLRTTRDAVTEAGGPFALQVARDRHVAGFVDGGVMVARSDASTAPFRPFVSLGIRYQIEGRRTDALASYAGGPLGLTAFGASRAEAVGTASVGLSYRLAGGLELFSTASAQTGQDDHQESITTGVRLRF